MFLKKINCIKKNFPLAPPPEKNPGASEQGPPLDTPCTPMIVAERRTSHTEKECRS